MNKLWLALLPFAIVAQAQNTTQTLYTLRGTQALSVSLEVRTQDAEALYFTQSNNGERSLWRIPKAGGEAQKIADKSAPDSPSWLPDSTNLALLGGYLYYRAGGSKIYKLKIGGAAELAFDTWEISRFRMAPIHMLSDGSDLYIFGSGDGAGCVAGKNHSLWKFPVLSGGAPSQLAEKLECPGGEERKSSHFASDDTHIYFLSNGDMPGKPGKLQRIAKTGGAVQTLFSSAVFTGGFGMDATHLYFVPSQVIADANARSFDSVTAALVRDQTGGKPLLRLVKTGGMASAVGSAKFVQPRFFNHPSGVVISDIQLAGYRSISQIQNGAVKVWRGNMMEMLLGAAQTDGSNIYWTELNIDAKTATLKKARR